MISDIQEATSTGAKVSAACKAIELPESTYYAWCKKYRETQNIEDNRRTAIHPAPANKLSNEEVQKILDTAHSREFADTTPHIMVPTLADRGEYIGSVSTIYRYLRENKELRPRRPREKNAPQPKTWVATAPNQVWVWDITYLPTGVKGIYFYFYLFTDIFDRYPVGGEVYDEQSADLAQELFRKLALQNHITSENGLVLHSDNGKPMVAQTMVELLKSFGVVPSKSRPSVSNDNAYAESIFSTAKSTPDYPEKFIQIDDARRWAQSFIVWARRHLHSGIAYLAPADRREGRGEEILANRTAVFEQAKSTHPERWNGRPVRDWTAPDAVYLNPSKEQREQEKLRKMARNKARYDDAASHEKKEVK